MPPSTAPLLQSVEIPLDRDHLAADLVVPQHAVGLVLFAHGGRSGRHSTRNRAVAQMLNSGGLATAMADLVTKGETADLAAAAVMRADLPLLTRRLHVLADWLAEYPETAALPLGLFGVGTGAGAALLAAAERRGTVRAVVSRGGRPDLAGDALRRVDAPTLLIVGGNDLPMLDLNRRAMLLLSARKEMALVPGATHLFEAPGALEEVGRLARDWFLGRLPWRMHGSRR